MCGNVHWYRVFLRGRTQGRVLRFSVARAAGEFLEPFEVFLFGARARAGPCGNDLANRFPELAQDLRAIESDLVVDGELVVLDEFGRPQWERLTRRHVFKRPERIRAAASEDPAAIFAFDLLWLDGEDYRGRALLERKAALHEVLPYHGRVWYAGHFADFSTELWALAVQLELEGIVAKDETSIYSAGRTTRWQKIKTPIGTEREKESARRP